MTMRDITQIPGLFIAHSTNEAGATGCTVICCPAGATGGVDVRGGAPASRETDLLRPEETVDVLHAVVLSGGSAFGLAASCGVTEELERRGIGLDVGVGKVPIVSSACLFDLACGDPSARPTAEDGARATALALEGGCGPLRQGNVGAGTGCTVGKLAGPDRAMKSGLGTDVEEAGGLVCGAVSAVNACGNVVDPTTGEAIAGMRTSATSNVIADECDAMLAMSTTMPLERTNTTISCVMTNARLTKAQATKVAQMSADAYAHAIRPTHTSNDGDTIFVMATGEVDCQIDVVGVLSTRALERAIANAASLAPSAYGLPGAAGPR
jgi:L-aminopeptidase/D-esterase-like protein